MVYVCCVCVRVRAQKQERGVREEGEGERERMYMVHVGVGGGIPAIVHIQKRASDPSVLQFQVSVRCLPCYPGASIQTPSL